MRFLLFGGKGAHGWGVESGRALPDRPPSAPLHSQGILAPRAEPALQVLGRTVEKLSNGKFTKSLLIGAVCMGVACGMDIGVWRRAGVQQRARCCALPAAMGAPPPALLLRWRQCMSPAMIPDSLTRRCSSGVQYPAQVPPIPAFHPTASNPRSPTPHNLLAKHMDTRIPLQTMQVL